MPDLGRKIKPCGAELGIVCHDEALFGPVVAHVPVAMERGGKVVEEEGNPVRFTRGSSRLDQARELRRQPEY